MANVVKRRQIDCGANAVDRISNLPRSLIGLILERLPMHDAARTTVLSKAWRNIWVMHQQLAFDEVFFSRMVSKIDEQAQLSEVSRTISNILLLHSNPLLKFHLSIPRNLPLHQCLDTDMWIKHLANSGIRILELFNKQPIAYKVPSYMFSCVELTQLNLRNCTLNPPLRFSGFPNLVTVKLLDVIITASMTFGTRLQVLELRKCAGIEHLGCQFDYNNNLGVLRIICSKEIDWRWFECTKKVKTLVLVLKGSSNLRKPTINLDKLLGNMPRISGLHLSGSLLKCLERNTSVLERPITTMGHLTFLNLFRVGLYDFVQIQYAFCLLRSSPKLKSLYIVPEHKVKTTDGTQPSAVERYLQSPNLVMTTLDQLETVYIPEMVGSRSELHFIKFLLASSPSLVWMKLSKSVTIIDPKEELRILGSVTRLPRVSTTAQIIWA